jgi:hypothetical protein
VDKRDPGARDRGTPALPGYTTTVIEVIESQTTAHVEYLAHHWILLAVPAFLPAVIVVSVILYIALRDRRAARNTATGKPDGAGETADAANKKGD